MGDTKICRYCGKIIYSDSKNCDYCGKYLYKPHDNPDMVCEVCKSPVNSDDNFCQVCGAIFSLPEGYDPNDNEPPPRRGNRIGIPYNKGILLTSIAASIAITVFATAGKETSIGGYFLFLSISYILAEIFLYIYFLPSIIAIENNNPNACFVYICNLLLGITIIGWIISLVFALQNERR